MDAIALFLADPHNRVTISVTVLLGGFACLVIFFAWTRRRTRTKRPQFDDLAMSPLGYHRVVQCPIRQQHKSNIQPENNKQ
ncbi:MAG: hypothetical protein HQL95_07095 [Magnetococcales bacterium]|nr:hypothetical protein [Magnetococcales bacterium]